MIRYRAAMTRRRRSPFAQSIAHDVLGPAMSDTPIQVPDTEHSLEMLTIAPVRVH